MDIAQLQKIGAIIPRTLHKREVEFTRPALKPESEWQDAAVPEESEGTVNESVTVWIRKRSSADFLDIVGAEGADRTLLAVQRCVCDESGGLVFSDVSQVRQLAPWLLIPLLNAVNEVNAFGEKKSKPRTNSGSISPSPSAGAVSRSGRKRSARKKGPDGSATSESTDP